MTQTLNYQENRAEIDSKIRNLESLPAGLGCKFLLTIKGHNDTLIAKQWKRRKPKTLKSDEVLIIL